MEPRMCGSPYGLSPYYFKICPYTKMKDPSTGKYQKIFGKWSKVKKVKAKK